MRHQRVFLIRHGETEWSVNGRHRGITDISLTENGRAMASRLGAIVGTLSLAQVLTSPLSRARQSCELAGLSERVEIDPGLIEWGFGAHEGLTQQEIRTTAPGWVLFTDRLSPSLSHRPCRCVRVQRLPRRPRGEALECARVVTDVSDRP